MDDPFIGFSGAGLRFDRLLGRGAMGAVYQGVQLALDRTVAIKVIATHLADDTAYVERFQREARTLGRLIHPHVIACHDVVRAEGPDGKPLLAMVLEFVDGWSLGTLLAKGALTARQAIDLHAQAADGLAAAHALGIVHRDIKPDNIMVARRGGAKLADFGLAKANDSAVLTQTGALLGSPAYMSPEACRGEEPAPSGDLYSLACSLYHALTGHPPYPGVQALQVLHLHLNAPVPSLAAERPDLVALEPLLRRCLAKDARARPADAAALNRELRRAALDVPAAARCGSRATATGTAPATIATPPQARPDAAARPRSARGRWALIGGAVVAVLLVVLAASAAFGGHPRAPDDRSAAAPVAAAAQPATTPSAASQAQTPAAAVEPPATATPAALVDRATPAAASAPTSGAAPAAVESTADSETRRGERARAGLLRAEDQLAHGDAAAAQATLDALDIPGKHGHLAAWRDRLREQLAAPAALRVTRLRAGRDLLGAVLQRGDAALPPRQPDADAFVAGVAFDGRDRLRLTMPSGAHRHALILAWTDGATLSVAGGGAGAARTVHDLTVERDAWTATAVAVPDDVEELIVRAASGSRVIAAGVAVCADRAPTLADLALAPGALLPLVDDGPRGLAALVASAHLAAVEPAAIRALVPGARDVAADDDLRARLATALGGTAPLAASQLVHYANAADLTGGWDAAPAPGLLLLGMRGDRAPLFEAAPWLKRMGTAPSHGTLAALVIDAHQPRRPGWDTLIRGAREQIPGLPIIDLAEVDAFLARSHLTVDGEARERLHRAALAAAVREIADRVHAVAR